MLSIPMQALEGWGNHPSIAIAKPVRIADLAGIALSEPLPAAEVPLHARLSASHCLWLSTGHNYFTMMSHVARLS